MSLAAVRPDDWNLPLFLHVAGSMVLVGALLVVTWTLLKAWRGDTGGFTGLAFRTLAYVAIPSFIVMRVSAQWIASKEDLLDSEATWIVIGFIGTDMGALFLIVATVLAGLSARRLRRDATGTPTLGRVAVVFTLIPLLAYVVSIWAMTTKPT